jgi:hypothetical protein
MERVKIFQERVLLELRLVVERVVFRRGAFAEHRLALVSWLDAALVDLGRVLAVRVVPGGLVCAPRSF